MKKIVTILGARPQFVKAAVLSRIIANYGKIEEVIVHTGQHFDTNMSAIFFSEMQIPKPSYNLNINGLEHGAMTGQMLEKIEEVLLKEKPIAVVVYGDTNSTLAGALAAKKLGIKLIHIEAGLRSYDMKMPEEINRIVTDRISDLLLCPTDTAIANLQQEGFLNLNTKIVKCGDIMKDAVEFYGELSNKKSTILNTHLLTDNDFVLATIHRQDNTNNKERLTAIIKGLEQINKHCKVLIPLHPRTKKALEMYSIPYTFTVINPVGYFDMLALLKHCKMVITDSGGLQKEAFFNKKHCIIVRNQTEWIELVDYKFASLVGANFTKMMAAFDNFKESTTNFSINLYGNNIGEKIYTEITNLIQ